MTTTHPRPLTRVEARSGLDDLARRHEDLMVRRGELEWSRRDRADAAARRRAARELEAEQWALFIEAERIVDRQAPSLLPPRQAELWRRGARAARLLGDAESVDLAWELAELFDAHLLTVDASRIRRMSISPDPKERRRTRQLYSELHQRAKPVVAALLKRRKALAGELGVRSFYDELLAVRGLDRRRLDRMLDELYRKTRAAYGRLLVRAGRAVGRRRPDPWDLLYGSRRAARVPSEARFARGSALSVVTRALALFGIDLARAGVTIETAHVGSDVRTIAVRIPEDVRASVRLGAGAHAYSRLLGQLGRAYSAAATTSAHPLYKGYEWMPGLNDPGFVAGVADLFASILYDRRVLVEIVGLSPAEAEHLRVARRYEALSAVRRAIGWIWFERSALARPEADLDTLSAHVERRHTGTRIGRGTEPIWAASPFVGVRPGYAQTEIIGGIVASHLRAALSARAGSSWISARASRHLTERALRDGARWTLDEKMIRATGFRLAPADHVDFLLGA